MKLYIDTRDREKIKISVVDNKSILVQEISDLTATPESALSLISHMLEKAGVDIGEINEITVERGPGSYTGTRVGVAVANALSFSLQVPVNSRKISEMETPKY